MELLEILYNSHRRRIIIQLAYFPAGGGEPLLNFNGLKEQGFFAQNPQPRSVITAAHAISL